jgi:hypothetical protein
MEININDLCKSYEKLLTISRGKDVKVTYFSGHKPSNYFLPDIKIGTKIHFYDKEANMLSWFSEIFIDDKCIFRETYFGVQGKEICERKIIEQIFFHGMANAEQTLEHFSKIH